MITKSHNYKEFTPTREYCLKCKEQTRKDVIEEFSKKLKERDFILSILDEEVSIDTEEEVKFICIDEVRNKIDKIKKELKGKEEKKNENN